MERPSQILATRAPHSNLKGLARSLDQRFGDHAATAIFTTASHRAARAHRSFTLGEIIAAAIQAAGAIARRTYTRYRQRRQARAIYEALHQLNDHTLRDLGLDRSEITSVAAEVTGEAERTRVRVIALAETPDRRYWTAYDHFMVKREARAMRHVYLRARAAKWWTAARRLFA
jgi:uncharacterized protein YjiS (DUF1127 family)